MRRRLPITAAVTALLVCAMVAWAQRGRGGGGGGFGGGGFGGFGGVQDPYDAEQPRREGEFHFIRMEYTDLPYFSRGFGYASRSGMGRGWWVVDWPAAENHFTTGINRLTRVDAGDPRHLRLNDPHLFDYPWLYCTQAGYWDLSTQEVALLREYLLRGGFLVTDDFWGPDPTQWEVFRSTMDKVLPGQAITDLVPGDPVMSVVYHIEQKDLTFIPGSRHLRRGYDGSAAVIQPAGTQPAWRGIEDGRGHMVVAANYNTDVGDAWEFADVPYYPENMTRLAYRYGINYLVYAMTH